MAEYLLYFNQQWVGEASRLASSRSSAVSL